MIPTSRLSGWHDRLEAAQSVPEVVEACHDFVGRFAPAMLAQLPRGCLPPVTLDAATISAYAVELVRCELEAGADASPVLSTFALFFTDASEAVARIALARRRPDLWSLVARRA
jgi:hypothetical protein